jgi:hypothetical protein
MATMVLAGQSCGTPKPPPHVPPNEVSCEEACRHVANDLPLCGTSVRLCFDLCVDIARNNPQYPTCLARGQSCDALRDCQ